MAVGDILNQNSNSLIVVTTEGWCYIYNNATKKDCEEEVPENVQEGVEQVVGKFLRPATLFITYKII